MRFGSKVLSFLGVLALVASMFGLAGGTAATAAATSVTLQCEATPSIGGTQHQSQTMAFDVSAPASVTAGQLYTVTATAGPIDVPSSAQGVNVTNLHGLTLGYAIPAGATFDSVALSGGSNLGSGVPSAALSGGRVVLSIPGPIAGGAHAVLPTLSIKLRATGSAGATLPIKAAGTTYGDGSYKFTVKVDVLGGLDVPTACYPSPSPVLATTSIAAPPDTTAPAVTVATPSEGSTFQVGSTVPASFGCTDTGGSGVASCTATVNGAALANGATLPAGTLGARTVVVTGKDVAGNQAQVTRHYTVVAQPVLDQTPPSITLTSPADGATFRQGQSVPVTYSCNDAGGVSSCVGTSANGGTLDTSSPGAKTFRVDAVDTAGNPATVVNSYRVLAGTPTTIGPNLVGTLSSGASMNIKDATVQIKVAAPTSNGGQLLVGDTLTIDWQIYRAHHGTCCNFGPDPVNWNLPAPTGSVITGPVTVDEVGFNGETQASAHPNTGATGVKSITPSANPDGASSIGISFDDNSTPIGKDSDGILIHARFTAVVTSPGPVTVKGFPNLTGTDCVLSLADCSSFSAAGMSDAAVGIAFTAVAPASSGPSVTITAPTNGQVVAPNGAATATYSCTGGAAPITCVGDAPSGGALPTGVSGPKQFHVVANDANGASTERWVTWTVAPPTVGASGCSVARGAPCNVAVSLSNPSSKPVTVAYATADGTAAAGTSYTATSGTLTFAPGETAKQVPVTTTAAGPGGTFTLNLSNPSGASVGNAVATGTITVPPVPKVSVADASLTRPGTGTASMVFTVSLPGPATSAATVHYATADGTGRALFDYTPRSGTLTIPVGQPSATVSVPIIGNQADDPDKTLLLAIDSPTNATLDRSQATGTILANHQIGGCPANPTQVQRFVCHTYVDALGRIAEPAGRDYWVNLINTGTPRSKMASTYMKTPEARQVLINRVYLSYLQRNGDQEGVKYWADQLLVGRTPDSVRVLILGSDEYFQTRGQSSNLTFVRQMYLDVFRRPVDAGGEAYWTGLLNGGLSRAEVAGRFVRTAEGRQHLIEDIYDRFLRRVPSPTEVTTWVNKLAAGSSEVDVYVALVSSDEYFTR